MTVHGYELTTEWKNSNCGQIAKAKKGGVLYFLKKYQTPVAPLDNGTLDAKTFAHNKKLFDEFVDTHKKINAIMRTVAGSGGNIVIPRDEFIEGNHFFEASELIENVVRDEELKGVLASLSDDVKLLLMKTAAGALSSVHRNRIVHSDLKPQNVLLARNRTGNYVAKLIDFDSSYFVDEKPEEIIGTIDYYSPELGAYADAEDDREEMEKKLTEKSDIFSLGLIFHLYLCGELPKPTSLTERLRKRQEKGKVIYCWVALNNGCELQLSSDIKSPKFISLISDMLSLNPDDRPSAADVLRRLQAPAPDVPVIEEPWPEHNLMLDKEKIISDDVVEFKKVIIAGQHKYGLLFQNGRKDTLSKENLIEKKYAKNMGPRGFADPWPEHQIEFDFDIIKSRGYVSSEQKIINEVKGYLFYRGDSTTVFFRPETLVSMGYAKKKGTIDPPPPGGKFAPPWPEHKIRFDIDAIKAKGFVRSEQYTLNGIKGYNFIRADGKSQFILVEMVLIQKMAKKL